MSTSHPAPPPPPPPWATQSIAEHEWITHEAVSPVRPQAMSHWPQSQPGDTQEVQVPISVTDRWAGGSWLRSEPTVQVEGAACPLPQVAELLRALEGLSHVGSHSAACR